MKKGIKKQTLGIILIIGVALQYVPILNVIDWLGLLAIFVVGIYLLIK